MLLVKCFGTPWILKGTVASQVLFYLQRWVLFSSYGNCFLQRHNGLILVIASFSSCRRKNRRPDSHFWSSSFKLHEWHKGDRIWPQMPSWKLPLHRRILNWHKEPAAMPTILSVLRAYHGRRGKSVIGRGGAQPCYSNSQPVYGSLWTTTSCHKLEQPLNCSNWCLVLGQRSLRIREL